MHSPPLTQTDNLLRSGEAPDARDGLRDDWHPREQVTREHVEAHAAAILRRPGTPEEAILVINTPTCTTRGRYIGCAELVPGMLPRGKRLAVYVRDQHGSVGEPTIYTGTGEGIAR